MLATWVAGEFFSRKTTLLRCRTLSSSRVRIASTTFRSAIDPTAMMLLVRASTANRKGTSVFPAPEAVVCIAALLLPAAASLAVRRAFPACTTGSWRRR